MKISERLIYDSLFNYFLKNKLFTPSQSGLLPGDSCIAQLPAILHEIQTVIQLNKPKCFSQRILNNGISYVKATARFDKPLVSFKQ